MKRMIDYARYRCMLWYETPAKHTQQVSFIIPAPAADIALERAERILRSDKRRRIRAIPYAEAVEL